MTGRSDSPHPSGINGSNDGPMNLLYTQVPVIAEIES